MALLDRDEIFTEARSGRVGPDQPLAGRLGEVQSYNLLGGGSGPRLYALVHEPFTGPTGTTLAFRLAAEPLTRQPVSHLAPFAPTQVLYQSPTFGLAELGPETVLLDVPVRIGLAGRVGLIFTIAGPAPFTAGSVQAGLSWAPLQGHIYTPPPRPSGRAL